MYFMSINKFKPDADRQAINKVLPAHREWVKQKIVAQAIVQAGKWGDNGGMIIVSAPGREEADRIVDEDPLVKAGLIAFETAELHAAVSFK